MSSRAANETQGDLQIFGSRLRWARQLRRQLAKDVAAASHVSGATLARLEKADSSFVDRTTAAALSMALHVPLAWLSEQPRAYSGVGSHFRANSRMTKASQEVVSTWQSLLAELLATIDRSVALLPTTLPVISAPEVGPEQAAATTRAALGFSPDQPIPHLMRSLEKAGVFVAVLDFDEEIHLRNHDASSAWFSLDTGRALPVVLCRKHSSWERTRFSLAHEVGHLVLHRNGAGPQAEEEATVFAAELILPATTLRRKWPARVTTMSLLPLKLEYGMSIAALIQHGYRHGLLDDQRRTSLFKQLSNSKDPRTGQRWRVREPGADDRPVERPLLVANALEVGYGVPPALDQVFDHLPATIGGEWYGDLLLNFACSWSRELAAKREYDRRQRHAPTAEQGERGAPAAPSPHVVPPSDTQPSSDGLAPVLALHAVSRRSQRPSDYRARG